MLISGRIIGARVIEYQKNDIPVNHYQQGKKEKPSWSH